MMGNRDSLDIKWICLAWLAARRRERERVRDGASCYAGASSPVRKYVSALPSLSAITDWLTGLRGCA